MAKLFYLLNIIVTQLTNPNIYAQIINNNLKRAV